MSKVERTLVIVKPDAVTRGLMGEVLNRFERKGLKIVAAKFTHLTEELLNEHYAHIKDKPFFPGVLKFMTSAPSLAFVLEGKNVVQAARQMAGSTDASEALPGTIRGDFALSIQQNVVHISEDLENAEKEIKNFFKESDFFDYHRADLTALYAADEL
ncbi:nucleoside-diphosphate kinase [Candidatus Berkelbacteria bacterium]|nr:nucleoside-diphosphate kinase [Candidatus Berkelbacteria bacterium]